MHFGVDIGSFYTVYMLYGEGLFNLFSSIYVRTCVQRGLCTLGHLKRTSVIYV